MPILITKRVIPEEFPKLPTEIKNDVESNIYNFVKQFLLPKQHDLILSEVMLDKSIEANIFTVKTVQSRLGYYMEDKTPQCKNYLVNYLVKKTISYIKILDSQDKIPEIINEYIEKHGNFRGTTIE